jgi:hypothetical protein
LAVLGVAETIELFNQDGVPTKVEPTGKVFPVSDKATDVLAALVRRLQRSTCTTALDEPVTEVDRDGAGFRVTTSRRNLHARKLLITTGGQSYPGCGTIGDGYRWAAQLGHTIVTPRPALVPITTSAPWVRELGGITIPDVNVRVRESEVGKPQQNQDIKAGRILAERRGSLLFAHFGLSGPVILDVSRAVSGHVRPQSLKLECDFLPALGSDAFVALLREQALAAGKKELANLVSTHLPRRLCEALLAVVNLPPQMKVAELGLRGWNEVAATFKTLTIPVTGTLGFKKAEVTAGGVSLDEVNSSTMQSKLVPNLYLAGEVLNLDGPIGGYNFQAAWSTGTLAGLNMQRPP